MSPVFPSSSSNQASSGFSPAIESGSLTFSSAVSIGSRLKNWKMKPMCAAPQQGELLSLIPLSFSPAISTSPEVGSSSPARMCINVDLPEPDGPITAVSSPGGRRAKRP